MISQLDRDLAELRQASESYAARHQFIPDFSYPPGVRIAVNFTLDKDVQLEVASLNPATNGITTATGTSSGAASVSPARSNHPNLPTIRFLPDGSLSETSPQTLRLTGRDGLSIWVALSRNRLSYEIRNRKD